MADRFVLGRQIEVELYRTAETRCWERLRGRHGCFDCIRDTLAMLVEVGTTLNTASYESAYLEHDRDLGVL